jgi:hypothetical protein
VFKLSIKLEFLLSWTLLLEFLNLFFHFFIFLSQFLDHLKLRLNSHLHLLKLIFLLFVFLSEQEVVLDCDSIFNLFKLEVISASGYLYSLVHLFLIIPLVNLREDKGYFEKDSQESSNLTKTWRYTFWVPFVFDVDVLNVKINPGLDCSGTTGIWKKSS